MAWEPRNQYPPPTQSALTPPVATLHLYQIDPDMLASPARNRVQPGVRTPDDYFTRPILSDDSRTATTGLSYALSFTTICIPESHSRSISTVPA